MVKRSEYKLRETPSRYIYHLDAVFLSGCLALFLAFIIVVSFFISGVERSTRLLLLVAFIATASACVVLLRRVERLFPDWSEFHEKILPSKENSELLSYKITIPVSNTFGKIDILFSYFFGCLGLALGLIFAISGMKHLSLLFIGSLVFLICCYNIYREKRVQRIAGSSSLHASLKGISLPISIFEIVKANKLAKTGNSEVFVPWQDIAEWIVDSGSSDSPELYVIKLTDGSSYEIYRSKLLGNELKLLEYVRAAGIAVTLRDSIAIENS